MAGRSVGFRIPSVVLHSPSIAVQPLVPNTLTSASNTPENATAVTLSTLELSWRPVAMIQQQMVAR